MARIFIEFLNADNGEMEWRPFTPEDIDWLMEKEILDTDSLGYAMDDQKAFDEALIRATQKGGVFSYSDIVKTYLSLTDKDIRIRA